jgi:glycerol-1-phosphatase
VAAGMDGLLVLSGISGPAELLACPPERRPAYVTKDVAGLFGPADAARVPAKDVPGWQLTRDGDRVRLAGSGEPVDALRLLCGPCWDGVEAPDIEPASDPAKELLTGWGITR